MSAWSNFFTSCSTSAASAFASVAVRFIFQFPAMIFLR